MNESMNLELFTSKELLDLHNALSMAIISNREHLSVWKDLAREDPSVISCVRMTESEIESYTDLLKKIDCIRGL